MATEIIAAKQVRRLCPGKDARAFGQSGTGEAVDIVLREPVVALLPGVTAIAAGEDRAVVRPGEDRATVWLDQERVDMLIGQGPVFHAPLGASAITFDAYHSLDSADQHLLRMVPESGIS